jgi:cellulose synthase/poly-beta-1,6-N-acetylglucosamine synthase-like glycosyltransferase
MPYKPAQNVISKTPAIAIDISEKVKNYTTWLTACAEHNTLNSSREKINEYINEAMKSVMVGEQEVRPFAPFQRGLSALKTTTPRQRFILRVIGLVYVLGLIFFSTAGLEIIIAAVTLFYISDLLFYFFLSMRVLEQSIEEHIDDEIVHALAHADWPRYTILCPLYHEADVASQFVWAMQTLDYPADKLQILLLTEEEDIETRKAIQAMQLPHNFEVVTVPVGEPRTKPRACNYGLLQATGDYVVIYDAEDVPDPLQLKKAVLTFANHGSDLACVQAKLNFYNTEQNLLTRWFTAEYSSWFDMILPGLQKLGVSLPLGGTSNHFRAELLREVGAWDVFNVTEDCDMGLRLGHHNLKTVIVDSLTYEEATSQMKNWLRQRSRWIKGYMQTYLVHMRHPPDYLDARRLVEFLTLQLVIGGNPAILFVNPLMWMLLVIYILFHTFVISAYHALYPMPILYMGTICLVFGNFTYTYIHLIGCMKRGQYSLVKWTLLIPIYWVMMSAAAYFALYQLVFKPHYWEKTLHGLHLRTSSSSARVTLIAAGAGAFEIVATRSSSNISLTREDFEFEVTEKRLRVKVHTSGKHPAIPKHLVGSPKPQDQKVKTVTIEEMAKENELVEDMSLLESEITQRLPRISRPEKGELMEDELVEDISLLESEITQRLPRISWPEVESSQELEHD